MQDLAPEFLTAYHTTMDRYQTGWGRFCAVYIDGLVLAPLGWVDELLIRPDRSAWIVLAWAAVSYSSYWLYSMLLHARYGQTVGKRVMGVKVLDVQEQRTPTLRQALIRDIGIVLVNTLALSYLAYLILSGLFSPAIGFDSTPGRMLAWAWVLWITLELLTMLTNKKGRAFHDYIARTVVVRA